MAIATKQKPVQQQQNDYSDLGAVPVADYSDLGAKPVPMGDTQPASTERQPEPINDYSDLGAVPVVETEQPKESAYSTAAQLNTTGKGGALQAKPITDAELEDIAHQTGTDAKALREIAPFFTGAPESANPSEIGMSALGRLGRMTFNVPQKLFKKYGADPKYEHALDILDELAKQKQSYGADIADVLTLGVPGAKAGAAAVETLPAAAKVGLKSVGATGVGAVAGAAGAEQGEEARGAAYGAALGAMLSPAVTGRISKEVQKGIDRIKEKSPQVDQVFEEWAAKNKPEFDAVQELAAKADTKTPEAFHKSVSPEVKLALIPQDAVDRAKTIGTSENGVLTKLLGKETADLSDDEIRDILSYNRAKSLSKEMKRTYGSRLSDLQKQRDPESMKLLVQELERARVGLQAIGDKPLEKYNPVEQLGYNVMSYLSDAKPMLQLVDDKYGTSLEQTADEASKNMNLIYANSVRKFAPAIKEIARMTSDSAEWPVIKQQIESRTFEPGSKAEKIANFFETALEDANSKGAGIQRLGSKGYFPMIRKGTAEYVKAFRDEFQKLQQSGIDFDNLSDDAIKRLSKENPAFRQFANEAMGVTQLEKLNSQNLKQAIMTLNGDLSRTRQALNISTFAVKERSKGAEGIPEWAAEQDPAKAAKRWITGVYKYAALKDPMAKLAAGARMIGRSGDSQTSQYLNNLRADWVGGRIGTLASWGRKQSEKLGLALQERIDQARANGQERLARAYEGAKDLPNLLPVGANNIYHNVLGLSPKAALQNMASFYTQSFPELGLANATYYTARALPKLAKLGTKAADYVYSKGLIDKDWTGEAVDVLTGQLRKGMVRELGSKAAEKYSHAIMAGFKASELYARAMTALIAEEVGKDMLTTPALRNRVLTNIKSTSYRRALENSLNARDEQAVQKLMVQYMNAGNMYNYSKINQAEFGRTLGPLFSVFSKWPSMAVGSQMREFLNGQGMSPAIAKASSMFWMPYLTMRMADSVSNNTVKPFVGEERYEAGMGKKGLHGMMLMDATPTNLLGRGGILDTPAMRAANQVANAVITENAGWDKFRKAFGDVLTNYVPVIPLVERMVTDTIPRFVQNEPKKKED